MDTIRGVRFADQESCATNAVQTSAGSLLRQGLTAVLPVWLSLLAIALAWGITMDILPGYMEGEQFYPTNWAANLAHFDPHSYLVVAEQGYEAGESSVRFPLFPFLLRLVIAITGADGHLALFWLSKVSLLLGLLGVWLVVRHQTDEDLAGRAVLYMAFPILGSGYTWLMSYAEPLHLALWAFGFLLFFQRRYALCGLITMLTMWTRPQAAFQIPAFAAALTIDALRAGGWRALLDREYWRRGLLICGLPLLAYSAWMLHISSLTQLPLSPVTTVQAYGRLDWLAPWVRILERVRFLAAHPPADAGWTMLFEDYQLFVALASLVALFIAAARGRLHWGLVLFSALSILPGLSTAVTSIGRYALLTWIPLAPLMIIPRRWDSVILPFSLALSFLALVVIGLVKGLQP
ncbi:MAG: hypothetical protein JNL42_05270 [Anaerolineae bacterium]|nr:hypothetical protein [Anaerolineae bacterium]